MYLPVSAPFVMSYINGLYFQLNTAIECMGSCNNMPSVKSWSLLRFNINLSCYTKLNISIPSQIYKILFIISGVRNLFSMNSQEFFVHFRNTKKIRKGQGNLNVFVYHQLRTTVLCILNTSRTDFCRVDVSRVCFNIEDISFIIRFGKITFLNVSQG